ncbi:hypothetical protein [Thiosulfativibrio zosterae]|uniref:Glycosyl transferase family 1 domain-containing protein n=1 Tax=Thiosulfativibrio zosterae TaxID=2675053 RepID=A0A6F8PQF8_9GAMM|nr:hypothetical protein [Thiosulfativibrio zosterae]BBP44316.1 hypothetical protein THMIRHAT_20620 [Thiosulfativibrio zosterae]
MKFFLIYKGDYGTGLKGPEMRYIGLGNALSQKGHEIYIAVNRNTQNSPLNRLNFIPLNKPLKLLKTIFESDVIVLHGGGPLILLLSIISVFFGKKVILDNYVPHWIELDEVMNNSKPSIKLLIKSQFNVFRSLLGLFSFDFVIVANQRQQDLLRGMIAPFSRTFDFNKIKVIPFGCQPYNPLPKSDGVSLLNSIATTQTPLTSNEFLIGWLGGTYGWFNLNSVMSALSEAFEKNSQIKLVFFGVSVEQQIDILSKLPNTVHHQIIFLPWVPFKDRLDYWSAFDLSLVWGGEGYENDYASRTRNFDCLSLKLPIIQNQDGEWGPRLTQTQTGLVTNIENLAKDVLYLSRHPEALTQMKKNLELLAPSFYWDEFANKLLESEKYSRFHPIKGFIHLVALLAIIPTISIFFFYEILTHLLMIKRT